jgi:16S rRNA (cytosine967-C5)-methyltransferase
MNESRIGARARAEAAKAVDAVVTQGRSLDAVLGALAQRVSPDGLPLIKMLCYGTLRFHFRLRADLGKLLDRPLKARDSVIESLLAVGLFQLTDTRVPDHAAVSMTVEAVRLLRRPKYAGLVNAVLRNYLRRDTTIEETTDLEARFNHPAWFIERLQEDWPEEWQAILAANNDRAPMWLRVNQKRGTVTDYLKRLAADEDGHRLLPGCGHAICLASPRPVEELPGFADGDVSVQDAAAQIAAPWLLMHGGQRILDACAAPGGKSGHLLELSAAGTELTAIDRDPQRLASIHDTLQRLRLDATVLAADASNPKDWWDGRPFDRILLDAPCSATGVIRRHPDIKLLRRADDIAALAERQGAMLDALWPLLAPTGRLLYVTCSVLAAENEAVVGEFLAAHRDAVESRVLPNYNIRDLMVEKTCGFQILPGREGLDGFYFACLEKKS